MSKLTWDKIGERLYETGTKKGVLYPASKDKQGATQYPKGVPWNGLTAVTESPSGAEATPIYADDIKYLNIMSAEDFAATLEAYMYPEEFAECDGSKLIVAGVTIGQQKRKMFGLSYVTTLGNDVDGNDYGYKLHIVYGCMATPSEKNYATINDSPEAITMSWEISTTPVDIPGVDEDGNPFKPTAIMTFDSTKTDPKIMKAIEDILYGTADVEARLPLPEEIIGILKPTDTSIVG